jgi:NADH-quinone oxidoreductase subunit E
MRNNIETILKLFPGKQEDDLITILQKIQKTEGYISRNAVEMISRHLRISRSKVFGVASFYSQFRFIPPGRHSIKICLGTACHVQGGDFLSAALQRQIGIEPGQTTPDRRFDLERIACLGCCAQAPVMMIDHEIISHMSVIRLKEVLMKYE